MAQTIYDAQMRGDAQAGDRPGEWVVNFARDCERPYKVRRTAIRGALMADYLMPCRSCPPCRKRKMGHWAYRAIREAQDAHAAGRRTWFGTLTLNPAAMSETLQQALEGYMEGSTTGEVEDWWDDPLCDYRFALHREVLTKELQKYWKRLRKAGLKFRYLAVFERHKSGLPHIHWLLHETAEPIRKRQLQAQWTHGFTKVKWVKNGYDKKRRRKVTMEFAAFYVCKYLQKHKQSRQLASISYGKI